MNKHRKKQADIHRVRKIERACLSKVAFASKEIAMQKGQRTYKCPFCGLWHRSGKINQLIAEIKKMK